MKIYKSIPNEGIIKLAIELTESEFDNYFAYCEDCGDIILKGDAALVRDGNYYCNDCVVSCSNCGELIPKAEVRYAEDSRRPICNYCYNSATYVCGGCGRHFLYEDSLRYDEDSDLDYCDSCYSNCLSSLIAPYHTMKDSGDINFYGSPDRKNHVHMGIELEVDSADYVDDISAAAQSVYDTFGDFINLEKDGSLRYGFENITQPADLDYFLSRREDFEKMFSTLTEYGLSSHDNGRCGFHIHIDRTYFEKHEETAKARLLFIFERHWDNLLKFSRRTNAQVNQYAMRYSSNVSDGIATITKNSKKWRDCYSRFYCINLTNYNTIEIRLWRGTMNIESFIATIKFTARLAEIAKNTTAVNLAKMTFEDLLGDDPIINAYWGTVKDRSIN